jgi:hypothetical protein
MSLSAKRDEIIDPTGMASTGKFSSCTGTRAGHAFVQLVCAAATWVALGGASEADLPMGYGQACAGVPRATVVTGSLAGIAPGMAMRVTSVRFVGDTAVATLRVGDKGVALAIKLDAEAARRCALAPGMVVGQIASAQGTMLYVPGSVLAFIATMEATNGPLDAAAGECPARLEAPAQVPQVAASDNVSSVPALRDSAMPSFGAFGGSVDLPSVPTETDEIFAYTRAHARAFDVAHSTSTGPYRGALPLHGQRFHNVSGIDRVPVRASGSTQSGAAWPTYGAPGASHFGSSAAPGTRLEPRHSAGSRGHGKP